MAPEIISNSFYGVKSDIWSLGCVLIEMATSRLPWLYFDNVLNAIKIIAKSDQIPKIPEDLGSECQDFIKRCLVRDYSKRPSSFELATHPFLASC